MALYFCNFNYNYLGKKSLRSLIFKFQVNFHGMEIIITRVWPCTFGI